jgi:hypothetical protein
LVRESREASLEVINANGRFVTQERKGKGSSPGVAMIGRVGSIDFTSGGSRIKEANNVVVGMEGPGWKVRNAVPGSAVGGGGGRA